MQSLPIIDLDLRLFYQNTQNEFNFLVLYITEFRQISSYDALEMMERSALFANNWSLAHLRPDHPFGESRHVRVAEDRLVEGSHFLEVCREVEVVEFVVEQHLQIPRKIVMAGKKIGICDF